MRCNLRHVAFSWYQDISPPKYFGDRPGTRHSLQGMTDTRIPTAMDTVVPAKQGDTFDLKTFHRSALDVGSVGLDMLRSAVLGEFA
jgi:hypothetical protein